MQTSTGRPVTSTEYVRDEIEPIEVVYSPEETIVQIQVSNTEWGYLDNEGNVYICYDISVVDLDPLNDFVHVASDIKYFDIVHNGDYSPVNANALILFTRNKEIYYCNNSIKGIMISSENLHVLFNILFLF